MVGRNDGTSDEAREGLSLPVTVGLSEALVEGLVDGDEVGTSLTVVDGDKVGAMVTVDEVGASVAAFVE